VSTRSIGLAVLTVTLAACAGLLPGVANLPSDPKWSGGCGIGVGLDAVLRGASADARVAWAIDRSGGGRIELVWPAGYSARFLPDLQVLDATGTVVAREGDLIIGSCMGNPERVDAGEVRPPTWQPGDG
jgi:hypothetical protein